MSKSFAALIKPNDINETISSKYVIEGGIVNPATEVPEAWSFNVNADVALPRFWSVGADKEPADYTLNGTYSNFATQFAGFDRFQGSIGGGRFYIRTNRGVVIKGAICGGPPQGQTFVGSGTWLRS